MRARRWRRHEPAPGDGENARRPRGRARGRGRRGPPEEAGGAHPRPSLPHQRGELAGRWPGPASPSGPAGRGEGAGAPHPPGFRRRGPDGRDAHLGVLPGTSLRPGPLRPGRKRPSLLPFLPSGFGESGAVGPRLVRPWRACHAVWGRGCQLGKQETRRCPCFGDKELPSLGPCCLMSSSCAFAAVFDQRVFGISFVCI